MHIRGFPSAETTMVLVTVSIHGVTLVLVSQVRRAELKSGAVRGGDESRSARAVPAAAGPAAPAGHHHEPQRTDEGRSTGLQVCLLLYSYCTSYQTKKY